tara:strand:- start:5751 stop:5954 length:204 start_codon:yes stop_codon:yes gene_type:complete
MLRLSVKTLSIATDLKSGADLLLHETNINKQKRKINMRIPVFFGQKYTIEKLKSNYKKKRKSYNENH